MNVHVTAPTFVIAQPPRPITGFDLATRRRRLGVTQQAIADVLRVRRQRIAMLERERRPTVEARTRYLAAIEELAAR